jgi:hypothetical protein
MEFARARPLPAGKENPKILRYRGWFTGKRWSSSCPKSTRCTFLTRSIACYVIWVCVSVSASPSLFKIQGVHAHFDPVLQFLVRFGLLSWSQTWCDLVGSASEEKNHHKQQQQQHRAEKCSENLTNHVCRFVWSSQHSSTALVRQ